MKRSLLSAFGFVMIGKILMTTSSAIVTPILTRLLGVALYGQFATVMAIFVLLQILVTSGTTSGVKKYISEDRSIDGWKTGVWRYYLRLGTIYSSVFAIVLIIITEVGLVERFLGSEYIIYFYFLAGLTFVVQYKDLVNRALMGLQLEKYSEPLRITQSLMYSCLAIGLVYFGLEVIGILLAKIIAGFIAFGIGLYLLRNELPLERGFRFDTESLPTEELRSFSHNSIIYLFLLSSLYHVDVLMLQGYSSDTTVGYYKAALVLAELLWLVPKSVQELMIQSVSDLWRTDSVQAISEIATNTTRLVILFTALCSIGLFALADTFVPFYFGEEYAPAVTPLLILLPGVIGFAATRPVLTITQAKGTLRPLIAATAFAAILNLLLNSIFIPKYGMIGAAVATSIGYGTLPFAQAGCAKYLGYDPFCLADLIRIIITCVIAGPIIIGAEYLVEGMLALVIVPPLGAIVFVAAAVLTGAVTQSEVQMVKTNLLNTYL